MLDGVPAGSYDDHNTLLLFGFFLSTFYSRHPIVTLFTPPSRFFRGHSCDCRECGCFLASTSFSFDISSLWGFTVLKRWSIISSRNLKILILLVSHFAMYIPRTEEANYMRIAFKVRCVVQLERISIFICFDVLKRSRLFQRLKNPDKAYTIFPFLCSSKQM